METELVALMDDFRRQLDLGGSVLLFLLDLITAFYVVYYNLLTQCLADVGIHRVAL